MADTTPTLREAAQQFVQDYENGDLGDLKHYARSMRAALAEQAAEEAEPVAPYAWLQRGEFGGCTTERLFLVSEFPDMDRRAWIDSVTILPLYLAAPPAPARQPAPALTVGMLMEAGLMVGSTPDSVGTSNWAVRMLGALRALAVDQPDAPPAPAPTWPEWAEQILKIVREYSGYDGYDDEDGVDLPEEVREALEELTAQIERVQAKAPAPGLLTDEQVAEFGALCVMNRRLKLTPQEMLAQYRADRDITAAPPAPARQEPLTDEQIKAGLSHAIDHATMYETAAFKKGVRYAERAHGITAAPAEGGAA